MKGWVNYNRLCDSVPWFTWAYWLKYARSSNFDYCWPWVMFQVLTLTWTYGRAMKLIQPLQLLKTETWWYLLLQGFLTFTLCWPFTSTNKNSVIPLIYYKDGSRESHNTTKHIWVLFKNFPEMLNDTEPHIIGTVIALL